MDINIKNRIEVSLAPMLDVTTAYFRRFVRLISPNTVLFTEMIVSSTVIHTGREELKKRLGDYDDRTVVQIGGSDPFEISEAVRIIKEFGFREFNLNCGCPSPRVQKGCFGAILMLDVELVCRILNVVYERVGVIMSLKIRIGVDEYDSFEFLDGFIKFVKENTANRKFYVHARKCWLKGLSPRQNRNVPALNYEFVYSIKERHPDLQIILNGSITLSSMNSIRNLDGIMIGREAIRNIFIFFEIDRYFESIIHDEKLKLSMNAIDDCSVSGGKDEVTVRSLQKYFESFDSSEKVKLTYIQPFINLFHGRRGCKDYKRMLNRMLSDGKKMGEVLNEVLEFVERYYRVGRLG